MTFFERVKTRPGYRLLFMAALVCLAGAVEYRTELQIERADAEHVQVVAGLRSVLSQREATLAEFYARRGSLAAVEMAQATAQARRPRLMAAIAVVESNGSPAAVGRAGERGAWQVIPSIHGAVPADAAGQCDQSAEILERLLTKSGGNIRRAVSAYNGSGKQADDYSKRVLAMLAEVPR